VSATDEKTAAAQVVYRVREWVACFESKKTNGWKTKSQQSFPLKFGLGYKKLLLHPNGEAFYGAWMAMCLLLGRHDAPRSGWVTQNGKKTGEPLTAEDIALQIGFSASTVAGMLNAASSKAVGWMDIIDWSPLISRQSTTVDRQDTTVSPNSDLDLDSDLDSDSHSTPDASAPGTGVSVGQASPSAVEEKSEAMALAERCAACRPEYARNRDGFFAVIRGFTGPDRTITPEDLDEVIAEWCLDQSNAQDPAKVPTKWLRKAIADADVDLIRPGRNAYPEKINSARPLSLLSALPPEMQPTSGEPS
jgi:hypothetical protein